MLIAAAGLTGSGSRRRVAVRQAGPETERGAPARQTSRYFRGDSILTGGWGATSV